MSIGFRFDEVMTGSYSITSKFFPSAEILSLPFGQRLMEFNITWGPDDIVDWINPKSPNFMKQKFYGTITLAGICKNCPCEGTLTLSYHKGELEYDMVFEDNGLKFGYVGKKTDIRPWNLQVTHTTCKGNIVLKNLFKGLEIAESVVHFRLSTLGDFLKSFRFVRT